MRDFVIFGLSRWNIEFGCNIRDISFELAKTNRVLYVDVPLKRKERWTRRSNPAVREVNHRLKEGLPLLRVADNLWHYIGDEVLESVNSISVPLFFDLINAVNNRRLAKMISKAVKLVGFNEYVLINDNDIYNGAHLKKILRPALYVYYLRDQLSAMAYWKRHAARIEAQLINDADLIVANSQYLTDYAKALNPKSFYVGQGCDVNHFLHPPDQNDVIPLFEKIAKPIVGFIGALNAERLSVDLLLELATRLKDHNFVLVGQEDLRFQASSLHGLKNVFFLGRRDFADLPKFLHCFDLAINPQQANEITIGNYPRKVDEYLAAGKPVVATRTRAMEPFQSHVYLASGPEEFEACIRRALLEDNPDVKEARKKFASGHTWKNSVGEMIKAIDSIAQ